MRRLFKVDTISTGLAIFAMFFGAGNVVFPLVVGRYAGDKNIYAVIGFLLTAVLVPFIGLVAMVLFNGDYKEFFFRLGKWPGTIVIFFLMALIGPLAAIPRCIALSFTTVKSFLPGATLFYFSIISCAVIYFLSMKKANVVAILGKILSPLLLLLLGVIIFKGFISGSSPLTIIGKRRLFFLEGLTEGYNTMDIFAAFFFSFVVLAGLRRRCSAKDVELSPQELIGNTIRAGLIGLSLLAVVYTGFSYVSSFYGKLLGPVSPDSLISAISFYTLGKMAGIVACFAVSLACLTTAIALTIVFAEFLRTRVLINKVGYEFTLLVTVVAAFAVSNVGFSGIVSLIAPVLSVCYPALIVLSFINIAHKLWDIQIVKTPVYATFAISLTYDLMIRFL